MSDARPDWHISEHLNLIAGQQVSGIQARVTQLNRLAHFPLFRRVPRQH